MNEYTEIKGIVVDGITLLPIPGVNISDKLNNSTLTNLKGEFQFKIPILNDGDSPKDFPLNINKKNYTIYQEIPYTSLGDVKTSLGIIKLFTIEYSSTIEISKENITTNDEINNYLDQFKTPDFRFQEKIDKVKINLKSKTLPLIYNLAAQYGVSQLSSLVDKYKGELTQEAIDELKKIIVCPTSSELSIIIGTKNKLVKQLNNSLKTINNASDLLKINEGIIDGLDITYNVLKYLPTPSAVAGVGVPIFVINNIQDVKDYLSKLKEKLKSTNNGVSSVVGMLENILIKIISYLNFLDKITQICSPDSNQQQISTELTALTTQQSTQLSPIVVDINGFKMEVESESTQNTVRRRRSIARNKQGVIMLTGEWSFSSIDQILIDELVFYIQQNNLKAD